MKPAKLVFFITLVFTLLSCENDQIKLNESNYLIFGRFYGMCIGSSCVLTYKLTDKGLYEDTNHNYSGNSYNFAAMDKKKHMIAKDLPDFFPQELLHEKEGIIGCPDCYDQGGILIQYIQNGKTKTRRIDNDKKNVPVYLHDFIDKVHEKINLINEKNS